jgi:hypothetical protein
MLADFAEADDVAQETFLRLWRANLAGEDPRRVLAWIYRTGTRLAIDRLRERSKTAAADEETAALAELGSPAQGGDDAIATRRALAALARRLPPDELEVALDSLLRSALPPDRGWPLCLVGGRCAGDRHAVDRFDRQRPAALVGRRGLVHGDRVGQA